MFTPTSAIFTPRPRQLDVFHVFKTPAGKLEWLKEQIKEGLDVNEPHPDTGDRLLNVIIRACAIPSQLHQMVRVLIEAGADVNAMDGRGATPLSLFVLHVNRGLRYHPWPDPELDRLIHLQSPKADIECKVMDLDEEYQNCVRQSLSLLLCNGVDVTKIPERCPAIVKNSEWAESFEHKLMQQENRWHLLQNHSSIEYSTYNMFNTFVTSWAENSDDINVIHQVAWRGDAHCLRLLVRAGCPDHVYRGTPSGNVESCYCCVTARTRNGRNALHFLYQYCNKVSDLVECTSLLLAAGVDPNAEDENVNTPVFHLLNHIHVKRGYLRYLANTYTKDNCATQDDVYFHAEIRACIDLLCDYGADFTHQNLLHDDPLTYVFTSFKQTLKNVDPEFQLHGHYMVPYAFSLKPLYSFTEQLVKCGCNVDCDIPYHRLISCLSEVNLTLPWNTAESFCACLEALHKSGAMIHKRRVSRHTGVYYFSGNQKFDNESVLQHLVNFINMIIQRNDRSKELPMMLDRLLPMVTLALQYMSITPSGDALQHLIVSNPLSSSNCSRKILAPECRLILHLIHHGFNPQFMIYKNFSEKSQLAEVLIQVYPCGTTSSSYTGPDAHYVTEAITSMVNCMSSQALAAAQANLSVHIGLVACERCEHCCLRNEIPLVFRSLRVLSRRAIWKAMGWRFADSCHCLPLPPPLQHYVRHLEIT